MTGPTLLEARAVQRKEKEGEERYIKEREKKIEDACLPVYLCT